ncbi:MAG: hypothetical protein QOG76_3017, partial [Pseudonocardiales bacterium]|nr:hypothetical protein [Pseudonocardiales bacterium]
VTPEFNELIGERTRDERRKVIIDAVAALIAV